MQVVKSFFDKYNIDVSRIAVGVSGGADSLALVLLLKECFPNSEIIALTVDHQLRPSSYDEACYVAKLMKKYKIIHHTLTWEGKKPKTGIEEKARENRYRLLCNWCKENDIENLVIAHHLYDQAETFLMRLQRGSGLLGLASIDDISYKNGIRILRPLLKVHPQKLKDYLNEKKIIWVEDESNQCDDFLRVKMRKFLSMLENEVGISPERIGLAVENLQNSKSFIEETIENIKENKIHKWGNVCYSFDYSEFLSWHKELQYMILGGLIKDLTQADYTPESSALLALIDSIKEENFCNTTLGGCYIEKSDLRIWVIKEYRDKKTCFSNKAWEKFIMQNPNVRGIKIPYELKYALIKEKK